MFLFLLPSNIEQMCLKVLFEMPGEIKKTGTDKLDLLSFFLPSTPLPLEDTSSATLDSRQKTVLPEERDTKTTEVPTSIIHFQWSGNTVACDWMIMWDPSYPLQEINYEVCTVLP